jgi:hypothetical protein
MSQGIRFGTNFQGKQKTLGVREIFESNHKEGPELHPLNLLRFSISFLRCVYLKNTNFTRDIILTKPEYLSSATEMKSESLIFPLF